MDESIHQKHGVTCNVKQSNFFSETRNYREYSKENGNKGVVKCELEHEVQNFL